MNFIKLSILATVSVCTTYSATTIPQLHADDLYSRTGDELNIPQLQNDLKLSLQRFIGDKGGLFSREYFTDEDNKAYDFSDVIPASDITTLDEFLIFLSSSSALVLSLIKKVNASHVESPGANSFNNIHYTHEGKTFNFCSKEKNDFLNWQFLKDQAYKGFERDSRLIVGELPKEYRARAYSDQKSAIEY